ncbi:PREDICTED: uncharacterized protein LOC108978745 isoform X1 [Bactrocera latifrons]|uniref:Phospholipase A2 n=1 Tax=Bactrocera latifrons TaxID=174628 RepID=A0A0K8U8I6_BACLA|nr:PREDICTED: uncharacterized protein LOC108978745 isoform X1 [Bactrocera latifrons]
MYVSYIMKLNYVLMQFVVLLMQSCPSQNGILARNIHTTTDIILSDIRNAFKTITNNTNLINRIIPQMYEPVVLSSNVTFQFKIPDSSVKDGCSILTMQRSDLVDPVFPNLTMEYIRAQLNKTRSNLFTKERLDSLEPTNVSAESSTNTWSLLGLDGWSGAVALAVVEPNIQEPYPNNDILLELENGGKDPDDENVYIARVNDPFGISVKWEFKNLTGRTKRDVLTLYSIIQCATGCKPLVYKGYGCYCGFSGSGVPVDGIDNCCRIHDICYEHSNCISYLEYFVPYIWKCYRRKPLCALDHGEFGGPRSCAARLCKCDIQLSRCLRRFTCPRRKAVCFSSKARRFQNLLLSF